jgi:uncharacterized protein (TIGR01244 family)
MADIRAVTPDFAVAPQITADDMLKIAAAGFTTVINNRPDGEAPGQMSDAQARKAATAAGLAFVTIPITGGARPEQVDQTIKALGDASGPVLAYCRSGTRSITVWALAQASAGGYSPEDIVELADSAGYDLSGLRPVLERLGSS